MTLPGPEPAAGLDPQPPAVELTVLDGPFSVCRLAPDAPLPSWARRAPGLVSVTRTARELSVVCGSGHAPDGVRREDGWRALEVAGPLPFEMTGVLAGLADPLWRAGVGVFVVSTFDTDYVLVKGHQLERARDALEAAGHRFRAGRDEPL